MFVPHLSIGRHTVPFLSKTLHWLPTYSPKGCGSTVAAVEMATRLMTTEEIETFKRDGAVILSGFIDREQIATWNDEYWRFMQADPDDPSTCE